MRLPAGWAGSDLCLELSTAPYTHCVAALEAWNVVGHGIRTRSTCDATIASIAWCTSVDMLHSAHRDLQRLLSHELAAGDQRTLCASVGEADRRRLESSSGHGANAFLRAIPVTYHLQLSNSDFQTGIQFWLHVPIACLLAAPAACKCTKASPLSQAIADMFGDHEQSCPSHNRIFRHNYMLDALIAAARSISVSANREQMLSFMRSSTDDPCKKQPDGVFYLYSAGPLATLGDVTCVHPTTASAMKSKYSSVGSCACAAAERKVQKYGPKAERQQFRFVPLACETYGAPAEELVEFVRDLSSHADAEGVDDLRPRLGWGAPKVAEFAWQALSVARTRGIAQALRASATKRARMQPRSAQVMVQQVMGADTRVLGLAMPRARPTRPNHHGRPSLAGFVSGSVASSSHRRVVASAASSSVGRLSSSSPAVALGLLESPAPLPLVDVMDVDFGPTSPSSPPRHARVHPPLPRAVALLTLIVLVSVCITLALARGSLRDSLPSLRGSLRASFPSSDAGFVSKLAWDFIGYPLYIFFYVGLLMRVFAR